MQPSTIVKAGYLLPTPNAALSKPGRASFWWLRFAVSQ